MQAVARSLLHVPVFGWFLKDALYGLPDAKYYFALNLLAFFAGLTYLFGYPFFIACLLAATGVALTTLVLLTATDLLSKKR